MAGEPRPTGTLTFLFTDVEGSTALWEQQPGLMSAGLARHDDIVLGAMREFDGHVFSAGGDSFGVVFADASRALSAARELRRRLSEPRPGEVMLKVRVGLHTGTAEERDGNYFGATLNRAARLMSAGHGGQILASDATRALLDGVLAADLGEHALAGIAQPMRVWQLDSLDRFPPLRTPTALRGNVPVTAGELLGRGRDQHAIEALLASQRLVTLTGPGGVGKSSLALSVAVQQRDLHAGGVWWCPLAATADGHAVAATVASTVGVQSGAPALVGVATSIGSSDSLLVLDNCEHVLTGASELAAELLARCPRLHILVTSREPLGLEGERVHRLGVLDEDAAVALFVQRAALTGVDIDTGGENVATVASIVRHLDRLPLAVELAAARTPSMSLLEIRDHLTSRFRLLRARSTRGPSHHRTLRDTIAWSVDMLTAAERHVLVRAAVFAGSFSLPAALDICGGGDLAPDDVIDAIDGLVAKSILQHGIGIAGASRYELLESVRHFGLDELEQQGSLPDARDRHVEHFTAEAARLGELLRGRDEKLGRSRLDEDRPNFRAAAAWCLGQDEGPDRSLRLLVPLSGWGLFVGLQAEPAEWLLAALERWPVEMHPLAASARALAAIGLSSKGDHHRSLELAAGAVELERRAGVVPFPGGSASALALALWTSGQYREAVRTLEASLVEYRAPGREEALAVLLVQLVNWRRGDEADFDGLVQESEAACYRSASPMLKAMHHLMVGTALLNVGTAEAEQQLERGLLLGEDADNLALLALANRQLAAFHAAWGEPARAAVFGAKAIEGALALGSAYVAWVTVRFVTIALARAGQAEDALLLDAACRSSPVCSPRTRMERVWPEADATARQHLGADATGALERHAATLDETALFDVALEALRRLSGQQSGRAP